MRALSVMERAAAYAGRGAYWAGPAEEVEHLISRSRGGLHTADNLAPAGLDCTRDRGDQAVEEFRSPARRMGHDCERLDVSADVARQRRARVIAGLDEAASTTGLQGESWT